MMPPSQVPPPERLIHLGLGLASPLWPAFYAATAAGLALWSGGAMVRAAGASAPATSPTVIPTVAKPVATTRPARKRPSRARAAAAPAKGSPGV